MWIAVYCALGTLTLVWLALACFHTGWTQGYHAGHFDGWHSATRISNDISEGKSFANAFDAGHRQGFLTGCRHTRGSMLKDNNN